MTCKVCLEISDSCRSMIMNSVMARTRKWIRVWSPYWIEVARMCWSVADSCFPTGIGFLTVYAGNSPPHGRCSCQSSVAAATAAEQQQQQKRDHITHQQQQQPARLFLHPVGARFEWQHGETGLIVIGRQFTENEETLSVLQISCLIICAVCGQPDISISSQKIQEVARCVCLNSWH